MMMMKCLGIKTIYKMVNSNRKTKERIKTNKNNRLKKTIIPNNKRILSQVNKTTQMSKVTKLTQMVNNLKTKETMNNKTSIKTTRINKEKMINNKQTITN